MQSELKPCPFCGGKAYIDDDTMGHSVVCCSNLECRAQGPFAPNDDKAITAWNTRASDAEIERNRAEIERLRGALEPSGHTKAAYMGEFSFSLRRVDECGDEYSEKVYVPWDTIKQIMSAIRARAALKGPSHDAG